MPPEYPVESSCNTSFCVNRHLLGGVLSILSVVLLAIVVHHAAIIAFFRTLITLREVAIAHQATKVAAEQAEKERLKAAAAELHKKRRAICKGEAAAELQRALADIAAAPTPEAYVRMPGAKTAYPLRLYTLRSQDVDNSGCNCTLEAGEPRGDKVLTIARDKSFRMEVDRHYYDAVLRAISACRARFPATVQ
jgi:hypothetical protein